MSSLYESFLYIIFKVKNKITLAKMFRPSQLSPSKFIKDLTGPFAEH